MSSLARLWSHLFPNPRYFGWVVVGVGFLCSALSSPGQSFALSLYIDHWIDDLGVSRVELSSLYAVATLLAAACLPAVGTASDRMSARWFLTPVVALLGAALLFFSGIGSLAGLGVAFFAVRLLGQGAIGLGTLTATVRWFRRYRGRALAVVSLGYAFGEMVFPALIYFLIEIVGWRSSLGIMGVVYLLLLAPLVGVLLRERDTVTEPLDGGAIPNRPGRTTWTPPAEVSFTLREALASPVFWGVLACVAVPPLVMTGVIFHQVALFAANGWDAALVPPAFFAFAVGGVAATYTAGLLLERIPSRYGISASLALNVAAFGTIAIPVPPLMGALAYGTVLGLASGTIAAANSIVWPDYFGIDALGAIKGVVNGVRNGATAVGPPAGAILLAVDPGPTLTFLVFGLLSAGAGAVALRLRPPGLPRAEP
jgi:MFS family permease